MSSENKTLPGGEFVYFKNLPASTTDESLSAYLRERGLDIGPERIGVKVFDSDWMRQPTASAIVSVSREVVVLMVQWVLNGDPIEDKVPRVEMLRRK